MTLFGTDQDRPSACRDRAVQELLAQFDTQQGHWTGRLSSSALSTATAIVALQTVLTEQEKHTPAKPYPQERLQSLIDAGLVWLERQQNVDGGWGDTDKSLSNISTSMLCHAAFHAAGQVGKFANTVSDADNYLRKAGGVPALIKRYGKDKTFSIPILTHCALAGQVEWNQVASLPFEMSCLPANFYKTVSLPVVSYALPALIAIGQLKHSKRPTWFLPWRWVRNLSRKKSLAVLERIQPSNGGFLEATPLTSFVSMSLAGMGLLDHPVLRKGIQFLLDSVREEGSWPIDTNLATWVSTLSIGALDDALPEETKRPLSDWLLAQQYKTIHPYTNADPGGWSWTDLPGGVPDADDTPGAILALLNLHPEPSPGVQQAVQDGVQWLLDLQNRDGGFPTFCRGWGALPFDRSSNDISAHCLRAILKVQQIVPAEQQDFHNRMRLSLERGLAFLDKHQRPDGSWLPLWFGNQRAPDDENPTYGTSRVLAAYRDAELLESPNARRGLDWLEANQNADGGWGGGSETPSSVEETAVAIEALISCGRCGSNTRLGLEWLMEAVETERSTQTSPIGFYFAKLWYYEDLYPLIFTVSALQTACGSDYNDPTPKSQEESSRKSASLS